MGWNRKEGRGHKYFKKGEGKLGQGEGALKRGRGWNPLTNYDTCLHLYIYLYLSLHIYQYIYIYIHIYISVPNQEYIWGYHWAIPHEKA